MPAALRGSAEARLDTRTRARLNALMTTWSSGGGLDRTEFAGLFFGRAADDPVATGLRTAALTARLSGRQDALRDAAEHLAGAMQTVGLDRWSRFLDDAEARANEPSTRAALEKSRQTLVQRDAIRSVYPLETAIGIVLAGIEAGAAGVARAVGGAIVRQLLPKKSPAIPTMIIRPKGRGAAANRAEFQTGAKPTGELLPNAPEAQIPPDKVTEYALNPEHQFGGADKARVFDSVLGFNRSNATELISQIKSGVMKNPAVMGKADEYGQRFTVDIPITGPKGSAVVRTGWIIDNGSTIPRLVTLFVK